jgi:hypothetical protein
LDASTGGPSEEREESMEERRSEKGIRGRDMEWKMGWNGDRVYRGKRDGMKGMC